MSELRASLLDLRNTADQRRSLSESLEDTVLERTLQDEAGLEDLELPSLQAQFASYRGEIQEKQASILQIMNLETLKRLMALIRAKLSVSVNKF